ncbi:MAG: glycosyltransferase [Devosia sp.]
MTVRIAAYAMSDPNHFGGLHEVVAELVRAGAEVRFWTDRRFEDRVTSVGAGFVDIFAGHALDDADNASRPLPSRFVTWAAANGEEMIANAAIWRPDLVIYDGFALIGQLVAEALSVPRIIVTAGHAIHGKFYRERLARDPRVKTDRRCHDAVERLRTEFALPGASPFSYVADPSPWLNVHIEPAEWLTADETLRLGPFAFFGSLPNGALNHERVAQNATTRIYVSFGTIIWRYWPREALNALAAIADGAGGLAETEVLITLGGANVSEADAAALRRPNVRVETFVDQQAALAASDIFITHHGIGSTHEAIALGVPMLSYPFFWDQPAIAARAAEFGLALPLLQGALGREDRLTPSDVSAAISSLEARRPQMELAIGVARRWEETAMAERPRIARQIIALANRN